MFIMLQQLGRVAGREDSSAPDLFFFFFFAMIVVLLVDCNTVSLWGRLELL